MIYNYTQLYVYIYIDLTGELSSMYLYIYIQLYIYTYTHKYIIMYIYIHTHTHTFIFALHIHIYIYIIYIYIHTYFAHIQCIVFQHHNTAWICRGNASPTKSGNSPFPTSMALVAPCCASISPFWVPCSQGGVDVSTVLFLNEDGLITFLEEIHGRHFFFF